MNLQMFKLDLEKAKEPEIKLPTFFGSLKKQQSSRKTSNSALLTMPKPLTVWITINCGKFFKRWKYQTTCLLRNLYAGQEATVRTENGTTDWFQIGKGVCQGVAIFMLLFGINFNAYYYVLLKQFKKIFGIEEVRHYILLILAATAIIFINIMNMYDSAFTALTHAFFQVTSLTSSTGYASTDFDQWPTMCKLTLIIMMTIGACAGSTGGGIKVSRFILLIKSIRKEFSSYIHPKIVRKTTMDGRTVEHDVIRAVNVYLITFLTVLLGSMFIVTADGHDLVTSFTAVLATLNNIGPGLAMVGPTCNYSFFSILSKYVLILDMLAGRLELFPLLILFHPKLYKGITAKRRAA